MTTAREARRAEGSRRVRKQERKSAETARRLSKGSRKSIGKRKS